MGAVLLLGVVLGLDSFRASLGLGAVCRGVGSRVRVALTFGVCDGLAPVLGLTLGAAVVERASPWFGWVGPLALGGFGLFTLIRAVRAESKEGPEGERRARTWTSLGLPMLLSLDNMIAGFGLGAARMPVVLSALMLGTASGLMALAGLTLGSLLHRAMPTWGESIGGAALALLAVAMVFEVV